MISYNSLHNYIRLSYYIGILKSKEVSKEELAGHEVAGWVKMKR